MCSAARMHKTSWLLLLILGAFGCSSSSSDQRPAPGVPATAEQALTLCRATCDANATCGAGGDRAACLKTCDEQAKRTSPIRGDFAVDAAQCAGKACLDYQKCIGEVNASLSPTAASQKWCDDFAAKRASCGQKPMQCPNEVASSDEELGKLSACLGQSDCITYIGCLD